MEIEAAERRIEKLEILIMKIYEDQALGRMNAERYTALYNKYQEERNTLKHRVRELRVTIADEKKEIRSASKFIKLVDRYADFTVLTPIMINEFVDKVIVHERDRKNSVQTTQKLEIYFNFIGEYKPSTMKEPELTEEEKAELARQAPSAVYDPQSRGHSSVRTDERQDVGRIYKQGYIILPVQR